MLPKQPHTCNKEAEIAVLKEHYNNEIEKLWEEITREKENKKALKFKVEKLEEYKNQTVTGIYKQIAIFSTGILLGTTAIRELIVGVFNLL